MNSKTSGHSLIASGLVPKIKDILFIRIDVIRDINYVTFSADHIVVAWLHVIRPNCLCLHRTSAPSLLLTF